MNVFIAGGTGFIGRALVLRLRRLGHSVTVLTRNLDNARSLLGTEADLVSASAGDKVIGEALSRSEAVVNLAGSPLLGGRWTGKKKREIINSRVKFTSRLVEQLKATTSKPRVLVSASAIGYYGDRGNTPLTEDASCGSGFLAELCKTWEKAAYKAESEGIRVVIPRIGVVLGKGGGALEKMLPVFRSGLGGPIGSGKQFFPWIHIDDVVGLIVHAINDERLSGVVNATAPQAVPFRQFARTLGKALSRPAVLPVPSFLLRTVLGEASTVLLDSQRTIPKRSTAFGFNFSFPTLDLALADIVGEEEILTDRVSEPVPESTYLKRRQPKYLLQTVTTIPRPVSEVFEFFSKPENLGLITPPSMQFRIDDCPSTISEGAEISYKLKVGPFPLSWVTRIDVWESGVRFVDSQKRGPYSSWWHEHRFEAKGDSTEMIDLVFYKPPVSLIGAIANQLFIANELRRVFGYRAYVIRSRFGRST